MITVEQQKWLDHLSDMDTVSVIPWDPTCEEKYLQVKTQIQNILGSNQPVEHRGASSLKISGQDEIDIYIPVYPKEFDQTVTLISTIYGQPRSHYPLARARFVTSVDQKHVDVFVINRDDKGWQESELFYNYLLADPPSLNDYRKLKENFAGKSIREYYTVKIEFINAILEKIKKT